jgi:hypothetical protein
LFVVLQGIPVPGPQGVAGESAVDVQEWGTEQLIDARNDELQMEWGPCYGVDNHVHHDQEALQYSDDVAPLDTDGRGNCEAAMSLDSNSRAVCLDADDIHANTSANWPSPVRRKARLQPKPRTLPRDVPGALEDASDAAYPSDEIEEDPMDAMAEALARTQVCILYCCYTKHHLCKGVSVSFKVVFHACLCNQHRRLIH